MSEELQRTEEWAIDRVGKFTASSFVDVLARNKRTGEPLKSYHDLIWRIVTERMTQKPTEGPHGFALQWGTDVEPYAREAYEMETGQIVTETGFITHPKYEFAGASPDGIVGLDGGLEMKCPKDSRIHLERFIYGAPEEYIPQMQGGMWVTGRKWWDFVSYDPRMPESHQLLIIRVHRDDEFIKKLESAVLEAELLVQETMNKLMNSIAVDSVEIEGVVV